MNVKLQVLSAGVLFFLGQGLTAQAKKNDSIKEKKIEDVVVVGYRTVAKRLAVTSTASVKSETIEDRPNANAMNIVQGQLAGVNITSSSGQPGAKSAVVIRGVGTYNGNSDPLYVIDGFPSNSDGFRSINSQDIESIEVLKDASAISEFGNRGSNGVVVIKTKRGTFGGNKFDVRYQSFFGVSMLQTPKYNAANARELLTLENRFGIGTGAGMSQNDIDNYNINTNWSKVFFRPAVSNSHTLSLTTGGKNLNSYTSVGYFDQDGILRGTSLKRFNITYFFRCQNFTLNSINNESIFIFRVAIK
jgi:TonB-dependent SusC/RagA subfamily outer membrane receptor